MAAAPVYPPKCFFFFLFYRNIKILNDCSASGIWQGLDVNHRGSEAALRLDDCATPALPHCDAAAAFATSVLLEVMGCEF